MKKKYLMSPPGESISGTIAILVISAFIFILIWGNVTTAPISEEDFRRLIYAGGMISRLGDLVQGSFTGFWLYAVTCAAIAIRNYHSFSAGSRSLYVMRRIKSPAEKHIMCLSLPVIGLIAGLLLVVIMILIFRANYISAAGTQYPAEYYEFSIWRALWFR